MTLLQLFLAFLQVGLFSVGGGYAAMPLIQSGVVEGYHWLTMQEFTNLITIAEMTPGPIAVNSATFVGLRIGGVAGAVVATLGCILPSLVIVSLLSFLYEKYGGASAMQTVLACLRPVVVALIASAALGILSTALFQNGVISFSCVLWFSAALFVGSFFLLRIKKVNPILVMAGCGVANMIFQMIVGGI